MKKKIILLAGILVLGAGTQSRADSCYGTVGMFSTGYSWITDHADDWTGTPERITYIQTPLHPILTTLTGVQTGTSQSGVGDALNAAVASKGVCLSSAATIHFNVKCVHTQTILGITTFPESYLAQSINVPACGAPSAATGAFTCSTRGDKCQVNYVDFHYPNVVLATVQVPRSSSVTCNAALFGLSGTVLGATVHGACSVTTTGHVTGTATGGIVNPFYPAADSHMVPDGSTFSMTVPGPIAHNGTVTCAYNAGTSTMGPNCAVTMRSFYGTFGGTRVVYLPASLSPGTASVVASAPVFTPDLAPNYVKAIPASDGTLIPDGSTVTAIMSPPTAPTISSLSATSSLVSSTLTSAVTLGQASVTVGLVDKATTTAVSLKFAPASGFAGASPTVAVCSGTTCVNGSMTVSSPGTLACGTPYTVAALIGTTAGLTKSFTTPNCPVNVSFAYSMVSQVSATVTATLTNVQAVAAGSVTLSRVLPYYIGSTWPAVSPSATVSASMSFALTGLACYKVVSGAGGGVAGMYRLELPLFTNSIGSSINMVGGSNSFQTNACGSAATF